MLIFLITWRYHFTKRLGQYLLDLEAGDVTEADRPADEYGKILELVLPGYRFAESPTDAPTDLYVRLPSGEQVPFSDLSSGEKEVFFLLCFFQRHSVEEAVIIIDEPELHLHPSLARILLKTMQEMKPHNQIWLATQSSEVIDHAGRARVFFVRRNTEHNAEIVPSTDEEEALLCLRDFFGYSGYMGLAKAMIFTEGRNASADRKLFSMVTQSASREIKFIPSGSFSELERINRAVLSMIDAEVGWCKFFLIRDRDYLDAEMLAQRREKLGNRMYILQRHELENYLLNFELIAKIMTEIFDHSISAAEVRDSFHECAISISGNVLRDMIAYRLNLKFQREDFSVPKLREGQLAFHEGEWNSDELSALRGSLESRCADVTGQLQQQIGEIAFDAMFTSCKSEIENGLKSEAWIEEFPGKELLRAFIRSMDLPAPPTLQNLIIKEMARDQGQIPDELNQIIQRAAE